MPWLWVGRFCLNLARVELVERAAASDDGITITLRNGSVIDLAGADATAFLRAWDEHTAARPVERGPPFVLTPILIAPRGEAGDPGQAHG